MTIIYTNCIVLFLLIVLYSQELIARIGPEAQMFNVLVQLVKSGINNSSCIVEEYDNYNNSSNDSSNSSSGSNNSSSNDSARGCSNNNSSSNDSNSSSSSNDNNSSSSSSNSNICDSNSSSGNVSNISKIISGSGSINDSSSNTSNSNIITGQFFKTVRKARNSKGQTPFDIVFISTCGNLASASGYMLKRGFPNRSILAVILEGHGILNIKQHFHPTYHKIYVKDLPSNIPSLNWQSQKTSSPRSDFNNPNPDKLDWDWSKMVTKKIWESEGLNNESLTWSSLAVLHERNQTQRQMDKTLRYDMENRILYDEEFRAEYMIILAKSKIRQEIKRESNKAEALIDLQGRQDAMESQKKYKKSGQVSETQVEYKTDLLVKDNRKNRLDNDGTGKSTKSKKQKKNAKNDS